MRRNASLLATLAFAAVGASGAVAVSDPRAIPLVDQGGHAFTLAGLAGHPVVVTFVATRCTDSCPLVDGDFVQLARRFARDGSDARLVTVTLDPAYDRPFVMANEARRLGADPKRWRMASGTLANVERLMRSFGVVTKADERGVPDVHSTEVYILDAHARLATTLLLSTNTVDDAERAARTLR